MPKHSGNDSQTIAVDKFIEQFSPDVQQILQEIRRRIKQLVPEAQESMNYGVPTFRLHGKNLVHYAAFKKHIGFYPGPPTIVAFKSELSDFKTAPGTVQFPFDKPIPYDLIEKMTSHATGLLQ
jgi:uncharacterized protein YdhG (YjbR/CyaY superfamily)